MKQAAICDRLSAITEVIGIDFGAISCVMT